MTDLEALGDGEVTVAGINRELSHRYVPRSNWTLCANDTLVLQGDPTVLQPVVADGRGIRRGLRLPDPDRPSEHTLVMGPRGYRFSDYWRLGLPLSIMVAIFGTRLIVLTWPLR